jgi:hypothetical protein
MQRTSVWMEEKAIKRLEEIGKLEDRTVGYLIRKAVTKFLEEYKPVKK